MNRPTSVNIIAWFLIVTGLISLVFSYFSLSNPMVQEVMAKDLLPLSLQYVLMFLGVVITVVSGFALRKGQNWARQLYVGWSVLGLLIGLATAPGKLALIPGALVLAIIAFFLYRPNANAYFAPQKIANDA
jgi:hypothetical protein